MHWMTFEEATERRFQVRGTPVPQQIELLADVKELSNEIEVPGRFMEMGDIPGPSFQWYAWIGDRPIILEREAKVGEGIPERVFIHTSYLERQDKFGDWSVLRELTELPISIYVTRPSHIVSRSANHDYIVFRPDSSGWNALVYSAASLREAEELLEFLKQDQWNESCFIGSSERDGIWSAIRNHDGEEQILCTYPQRNTALNFACRVSLQLGQGVITVKERSSVSKDQYVVSEGRVISGPGL